MVRSDLVSWALLVIPGVIWGASFLFIAEGLEAMAPAGVTFVRAAIGFLCLSLVGAARRPLARGDGWPTAGLGVLWFAFPLSMFPLAEQHVSSALTGMLNGLTPIFTAIVAGVLSRQWPMRNVTVGLLVGVLGGVLMAVPGLDGASTATGVAMIAAALFSYGVALNLTRALQQRNGALAVVWRALGVAVLLTAPLGVPALLEAQWTMRSLLAMLALGALGTCVANVLTTIAAGRVGPTRASSTTFLIPVVALLLGVVVRGEQVALLSVVGAAVCLAGAWIMRRPAQGRPGLVPTVARMPQPSAKTLVAVADRTITEATRAC